MNVLKELIESIKCKIAYHKHSIDIHKKAIVSNTEGLEKDIEDLEGYKRILKHLEKMEEDQNE